MLLSCFSNAQPAQEAHDQVKQQEYILKWSPVRRTRSRKSLDAILGCKRYSMVSVLVHLASYQ